MLALGFYAQIFVGSKGIFYEKIFYFPFKCIM